MIGIIGGSGLYALEGLTQVERVTVKTPFGDPSDDFVRGQLGGRDVCFLPRHGRGHRLLPSEINHRANIYGFKSLGAQCVISVSAVGSLREDIHPRDIVLPDQYYDRTKRSADHTFFGNGVVAHVSFADPGCPHLREFLAAAARATAVTGTAPGEAAPGLHARGTYVNMEGPAFSTRAESHAYRRLGGDIIGMTSLPEAKLCREAEICYQAMAMVTDYDCWHATAEAVSVELVLAHLVANTARAKAVLAAMLPRLADAPDCPCRHALAHAIMTTPDAMPPETVARLRPIIGPYLPKGST